MYKTTLTYPRDIRLRLMLVIGLIVILILASLGLIAGSIVAIWSSTTQDGYQADRIPVVRNLVIPVLTPDTVGLLEPSIEPVPVSASPV